MDIWIVMVMVMSGVGLLTVGCSTGMNLACPEYCQCEHAGYDYTAVCSSMFDPMLLFLNTTHLTVHGSLNDKSLRSLRKYLKVATKIKELILRKSINFKVIQQNTFPYMPNLEVLEITSGKLENVSFDAASMCPSLKRLVLIDHFYLCFAGLNIRVGNKLEELTLGSINQFTHCKDRPVFQDASFFYGFQNSSLKYLEMTYDAISFIDRSCFNYLTQLMYFNISGNTISNIEQVGGYLKNMTNLKILDVSNGDIFTGHGRKRRSIKKVDSLESSVAGTDLYDNEIFYFREKIPVNLQYIYFNNLIDMPSGRTIPLQVDKYYDFSATNITGIWLRDNSLSKIDIKTLNWYSLELLDLSDNYLSNVTTFLKGLLNLKHLMLARNKFVDNQYTDEFKIMFSHNQNLQLIDLQSNTLSYLPNNIFIHNTHLRVVDLRGNKFQSVQFDASLIESLIFLDVSNNNIGTFSEYFRKQLDFINIKQFKNSKGEHISMRIDGNSIQCECTDKDNIRWMFSTNVTIEGLLNASCYRSGRIHSSLDQNENDIFIDCEESFLSIIISTVTLFVLLLGLLVGYVIKRTYRKYQLQKKLTVYAKNVRHGQDFVVFVSYCHLDAEWVLRDVHLPLEEKIRKVLCTPHDESLVFLNDKDFVPGLCIAEEIIRGIAVSKNVLFVVSENFLKSGWCEYETMLAIMEKKPILLLFKEKVDTENMPRSMTKLYKKLVRDVWPLDGDPGKVAKMLDRITNSLISNLIK